MLPQEVVTQAVTFIKNFASEQGLSLPGRVPQFKNFDVQLLPSSETKASIWRLYKASANKDNSTAVSYSKFVNIWNTFTPYIVMMTPETDLCGTCQLNNTKIFRTVNVSEDEKRQCIAHQNEHLDRALKEREFYRNSVKSCKETLQNSEVDLLSAQAACSYQGTVHYSYDYAQQVHFPSNPQQPGPIYFKTPRKCGLFGICCEGLPRQMKPSLREKAPMQLSLTCTVFF